MDDEVEALRSISDPVRQAREATALLAQYETRASEVAAIRLSAIDRAHDELDMTYARIADDIGVARSRISQIRRAGGTQKARLGVYPEGDTEPGLRLP